MEKIGFDQLINLGAVGVILVVLLKYLFSLMKSHREEREKLFSNLVDVINNTNEKYVGANDKTVNAIERNSIVVSELKGTMESIQKSMKC